MTQLTRHMYRINEIGRFGLCNGQMREPYVLKNLYWYNKAGEWLGHGDVNVQDLENISLELQDGEIFVLLSESAYLRFRGPDYGAPGVDYVAQEATLAVVPGQVYEVDHYGRSEAEEETHSIRDRFTGKVLLATYLTEADLRALLTA